ncbi:intradiol ring-cleavage dioxygenase [Comamonas brasiliensis]|nr:intradiol ring-cleavage dioxygenase [Comamonas sp. PE63]
MVRFTDESLSPMTQPHSSSETLVPAACATSRRSWLRQSAALLGALPFMPLPGRAAPAAIGSAAAPATAGAAKAAAPWLGGGTKAITAAVRGINPFAAAGLAGGCRLTCEATIGPCHTLSPERMDVSDGWDGLPLHMQIRVVNERCEPVAGTIVEIWHTNHTGGYSGQIHRMCNNDAADVNKKFFRGYQRTDGNGVARFDSCYPGWYRGRAVHVHFRILQGSYDPADSAASWLTSQLLFSDALNSEIFAQAPLYKDKGQPDTRLDVDNVLGQEPDKTPYVFDVQNLGGVMLASKTVVVRSDSADKLCQVKGSMPPGGPGGPGGPGRPGGMRPPRPGMMPPPPPGT